MLQTALDTGNGKYDRKHIVSVKPNFDQQLTAAMQTTGMHTAMIGPAEAEVMLTRNNRNRPLRASKVAGYAAQMAAGKWHYTRVPIIFSAERLIDGQHRLTAVVKSGATIKADVCFGAPDDSFAYIDVGSTRTGGDIFAINGVPNATLMAAVVGLVADYDDGTAATGFGAGNRRPAADLYEIYCHHRDLQKSAWVNHKFKTNRLAPPSIMCALHYICARKNRGQADQFFEKVADGVDLGKGDPALALRSALIRNATADAKLSRKVIAGMTVTAWNLARRGLSRSRISYDPETPFPRAQ